MTPFTVAPASPAQVQAARVLLAEGQPGLAVPLQPEPRWFVAARPGEPAALLGAAALWPVPQRDSEWGFRAQVQVQAACRRQGIGRALVAAISQETARWGVPRLLSWEPVDDGPVGAFLGAVGGRVSYTLHHFLPDKVTALPRCERLVERLHRSGHVPPGFALVPVDAVPREALLALHCAEFHAGAPAAARLIDAHLADPALHHLSVALWDGEHLAGYLLAGPGRDVPEVSYWATAPEHRSGWAAAVMLHAFVKRVVDGGGSKARYHCNALARAPMNFARRTGAPLEKTTRGWCLDLQPPRLAAPAAATDMPGPQTGRVLLALPGASPEQIHALSGQGALPHLAALLAEGHVGSGAASPWRDDGNVRAVGWPRALAPEHAPPGGAWVSAEFDDTALLCPAFWALDPQAVRPPEVTPLACAARTSPAEVGDVQLAALLAPLRAATQARLGPETARLVARWAGRHNLGVHWASRPLAGLLAVRFDGLPEWLEKARLEPAEHEAALSAWLGFFDLMLGRYRQLLGSSVPLTLHLGGP